MAWGGGGSSEVGKTLQISDGFEVIGDVTSGLDRPPALWCSDAECWAAIAEHPYPPRRVLVLRSSV